MTIQEAIEILQDLHTTLPQSDPELRREAVKLGIEALKRLQDGRQKGYDYFAHLLPGETERKSHV